MYEDEYDEWRDRKKDEDAEIAAEALDLMEKMGGSFASAYAKTYRVADHKNKKKLKNSFPELWSNYEGMARRRIFGSDY